MNTTVVNYKEVFQLAESKGYYFLKDSNGDYLPDSYYRIAVINEQKILIALTLLQKWLRDNYKIEILVKSCGSAENYLFKVMVLGEEKCLSFCSNTCSTYEQCLLDGTNEALQLI